MHSSIYMGLHVKCPLFMPDFNETKNFSDSNLIKTLPLRAELFHADGQT